MQKQEHRDDEVDWMGSEDTQDPPTKIPVRLQLDAFLPRHAARHSRLRSKGISKRVSYKRAPEGNRTGKVTQRESKLTSSGLRDRR